MTIEGLLKAAQEYTRLAIIEGASVGASHEIRATFAQLAQAAAQTAQAMDFHRFTEQWLKLSGETAQERDCNDPDFTPRPELICTCGMGDATHPTEHAEQCEMYVPF